MSRIGAGEALFAFVRHWSRRWDHAPDSERATRGREVLAVEAVHALGHHADPTVNDVAAELGLDQSNASRLLAQVAAAGHLVLDRSASDGRSRTVRLTHSGRDLLTAAHAWQNEMFGLLTADWTTPERAAFARAIRRLLAASPGIEGR